MGALFGRIEGYSGETLQVAEKTLNFALNWSVSHQYSPIVGFFAGLVLGKYNELSLSALKCIKTYLQMVNPRTAEEWQPIQESLLAIARDSRLSTLLDLALRDEMADCGEVRPEDGRVRVDCGLLGNKAVVQRLVVEMLPNHRECLEEVALLHAEAIRFNDNLYLRCLLWRAGLPPDSLRPPNLLTLEDAISRKLVAIYNAAHEPQTLPFSLTFFQRYCCASQRYLELADRVSVPGLEACSQTV